MFMSTKGLVVAPTDDEASVAAPWAERVANRAIISHALDALSCAGITDLAVVAPQPALTDIRTCIETNGGPSTAINYVVQTGRPDLLGSLRAAASFVGDDTAIVHFADGLVGEAPDRISRLLAEDPEDLLLLVHRSPDPHASLGPVTERLLGITELNGARSRLAVAGVCVFGPSVLRLASAAQAGSHDGFDMIAVAEWLTSQGHKPRARFVQAWRRYRGNLLDLLELNRLVLDHLAPETESFDDGDNRIEGRVSIHPTAELTSSIIVGPSIIGPGARISNSFVGPYTSIGARAELDGAEVERSIIADGARIMHIGRRIEGSTVGQRASISRDFALPRGIRLHVGPNAQLALS
jgi:glucose-1-phosphate thymidylyltransferase